MSETASAAVPAAAPRTHWARAGLLGVLLSAVVCLVALAFTWPSSVVEPEDVPVAITGPAEALAPVEAALDEQADGVLELIEVPDRNAAVEAIESRAAYGGIVLGEEPEVLTASAAGAATSGIMAQLHGQLQGMAQQQAAAAAQAAGAPEVPEVTVPLTDVVPLVSTDERGAGLASAGLPLVFGGMIGGVGIALAVTGAWRRVLALLVYAAAGGAALAGIMQGWLGFLGGEYWAVAGAFGLALLAMGAAIVGFAALLGRPGLAVGPVLFMLIGNPLAGTQFPPEFLPAPWGALGQWLPPGAGNSLLRDASYFPGADASFPLLVLSGWAVLGLLLLCLGRLRGRARH
ncbi:hypothetical protein [Brevibacterium salitolerans]|uniref:ABC transporter permease n=1 Tax=Brevibacterium salitolerans TaxID=1403566 RepID=A0ABN2WZC6_9MICO